MDVIVDRRAYAPGRNIPLETQQDFSETCINVIGMLVYKLFYSTYQFANKKTIITGCVTCLHM